MIEHRIRQCHAPATLVRAGKCYCSIMDLQHGIIGHERGGVPIGAKTEVDQIEHHGRACDLVQRLCIGGSGGLKVGLLHRHGVDLVGTQRCMRQEAFAQLSQVPVGIPAGATRSSACKM